MGGGESACWWAQFPAGRVVQVEGTAHELVSVAVRPVPAEAPVFLTCRTVAGTSISDTLDSILDELESAARALFPAWLPGAGQIEGSSSLEVSAL